MYIYTLPKSLGTIMAILYYEFAINSPVLLIDTCVTAWLLLISLCIFVIFQEEFVIWLVFFFILLRCFQGLDDVRPATSQNEEAAMNQCQFPHPPNMATCIL